MVGWVNIVAMVAVAAASVPAAGARTAIELDALATLRYRSAQTEAVAARVADAQLVAMRSRIDSGTAQLAKARGDLATLKSAARLDKVKVASLEKQSGDLIGQLAQLKLDFTTELAKRDAQYARDIAILQTAGEQLLATPEGAKALALYNAGGPGSFEAADAVLAQIEAARDEARADEARKQLAADRRARAELALDALDKGLTTTAVAIERREAVVAADPGAQWDWIVLSRLYVSEQRLADADRAAAAAVRTATDDRVRAVAWNRVGTIAMARNDNAGAAKAFEQALALDMKLIETAPDSENLHDITVTLVNRGNLAVMRGDYATAEKDYMTALDADRELLVIEPTSVDLKRSVMIGLFSIGDVRVQRGDAKGAAAAYVEAMEIARVRAAANPQSISALDDEARGLIKLGDFLLAGGKPDKAAAVFDGALAARRAMLQVDPSSTAAQKELATALQRVGDGRLANGDKSGAITVYEESLALSRRLAVVAPASMSAQRGLMVALWLLASADAPGHGWGEVAAQLRTMKAGGLLAASDDAWFAEATARAEGKPWP